MDVDLRLVRTLEVVAQEGSFAGAADRLGVSRSTLSRRMALLEAQTGVRLVARHGSGVVLTGAGAALAHAAPGLLASERRLLHGREPAPRGPQVVVGTLGSSIGDDVLRLMAGLRELLPAAEVRARGHDLTGHLRALERGDVDLALVWEPLPPSLRAVAEVCTVRHEQLRLLVHEGHRLAGAGAVRAADLRAERWMASPPDGDRPWYDHWTLASARPRAGGVVVRWPEERVSLAAAGRIVALVPESQVALLPAGAPVRALVVADAPPARLVIAWSRDVPDAVADGYRRLAARAGPPQPPAAAAALAG
jgi:DNA-binding transcriptional LysR family regulator